MTRTCRWRSLLVALLAVSLEGGAAPPQAAPSAPEAPPRPLALTVRDLPAAFGEAATAFRRGDCGAALLALSPLGAGETELARLARLTAGLIAYSCDDPTYATGALARTSAPGGALEDWRLLALAHSTHRLGRLEESHHALAQLLADHRDSPLWAGAFSTAVERSRSDGDTAGALELIRWSRELPRLPSDTVARVEVVALELARERGDAAGARAAARRLWIKAPTRATELGAATSLAETGEPRWAELFTAAELVERAEALLAGDQPVAALRTLDSVAAAERGSPWRRVRARALVADRRGREALALLQQAPQPQDPAELAALDWERALAALDVASPSRSGARLRSAERVRHLALAQEALQRVAQQTAAPELAQQALRRLFAGQSDSGNDAQARATLTRLRVLDEADTTGAAWLWNLGWRHYSRGVHPRAIDAWRELATIYPGSREARSGRYWTGRALEALGRRAEAQAVFAEITATDTTDFYRKHALTRLSGAPANPVGDPPVEETWPRDPLLERALLLSDLGLDQLGLDELAAYGSRPAPRARNATMGVLLSRLGRPRESIPHLRRAFPALGGPFQATVPLEARRLYYPLIYQDAIAPAARAAGLPTHLVLGLIRQESAFDLNATSRAGARGLMQLMPGTGREVSRQLGLPFSEARLHDPAYNVQLGSTYLGEVIGLFGGNVDLALAGYNGGPYRIQRLWRQAGPRAEVDRFLEGLTIQETRDYVKRVVLFGDSYHRLYGL